MSLPDDGASFWNRFGRQRPMDTLISERDRTRVPAAMSPETIFVTPLSLVESTVADARVSHLVTLINGETLIETPASIVKERHLRLSMNDISEARHGLVVPSEDHVSELIRFALDWDQQAPLLIHCWAGISRSTAAAFISLCALNPQADEHALARALRRASPTAYPNRRLVALADSVLTRKGRMLAAVEHIGRQHAALSRKHAIGQGDETAIGIGGGRGPAQRPSERMFVRLRVQRTERDEGRRGRAADAGPAMDEKRRLLVPIECEADQFGDVILRRNDQPVPRLADIVHGESEMTLLDDAGRRLDQGFAVDQGHQMADPSVGDRRLDETQGGDEDGFR